MIRRAIDIAVSAASLVLGAPVIALAALAVRAESRGHPIYRQRRVGQDGRPFDVLKLRTMVDGAEGMGAGLAVNENDSRITRVGSFLRRTSLDELPNLLNVLRGEMSLIGPRPTVPVQVERYTPRQRGRLAVKPGITGWAQVNGRASLPWAVFWMSLPPFFGESPSTANAFPLCTLMIWKYGPPCAVRFLNLPPPRLRISTGRSARFALPSGKRMAWPLTMNRSSQPW